jgi:DoxX-like family
MINLTNTLNPAARGSAYWIRTIAYWFFTLLVAYEMVAGGFWDLLRIGYVRAVLAHLGYPMLLLFVMGVWKIPCALAILTPRFQRLKEWAYAGAAINYWGAFASHLINRDGPKFWVFPLVYIIFTFVSWALRPAERRLASTTPQPETRPIGWVVPLLIVGAMTILALATLPKGSPF